MTDAHSAEPTTPMRAGQLAAAVGVNVQTLRYYERRGLLRAPQRTLGGHRLYPGADLTTLRVIKAAQRLGFTLDEVADLLSVAARRRDSGLQTRAAAKLAELDAQLAELTRVRDSLRSALDAGCDDLRVCAESPCCPVPFEAPTSVR